MRQLDQRRAALLCKSRRRLGHQAGKKHCSLSATPHQRGRDLSGRCEFSASLSSVFRFLAPGGWPGGAALAQSLTEALAEAYRTNPQRPTRSEKQENATISPNSVQTRFKKSAIRCNHDAGSDVPRTGSTEHTRVAEKSRISSNGLYDR
jgi:hypothetical protein